MDVLGIEVFILYYLFYFNNGVFIDSFDDIDIAISQYVLKRGELFSLRQYNNISNLSLVYIYDGDIDVLY